MMKTSITNREIWRIAYPIMLGNLAQTIITFTDTAFLGHLGTIELSASMMAGLFYFVFTTLAMGFAIGIQIFIARRLAKVTSKRSAWSSSTEPCLCWYWESVYSACCISLAAASCISSSIRKRFMPLRCNT